MFFNVIISSRSKKSVEIFKNDLSEEQLHQNFLRPYESNEHIMVNGRAIPPTDIEKISIYKSESNSIETIKAIERKSLNSSVMVIGGPSYEFQAAMAGIEVSDDYIKGPPGENKNKPISEKKMTKKTSNKIFLVHGHDGAFKMIVNYFYMELV